MIGIQLKIEIRNQIRHDSQERIARIFILKVASRRDCNKGDIDSGIEREFLLISRENYKIKAITNSKFKK